MSEAQGIKQAVIMAGGKGTRLAAITKDIIPKPMVPLLDKPLLEWQVECLKANGIDDIIMVIVIWARLFGRILQMALSGA